MGTTRLLSSFRNLGRVLATASVLAMVIAGGTPAAFAQQEGGAPRPDIAESVAAVVNDDIISSYDLVQRMRLVILTADIKPTQENLPQIQQLALNQLIEERLQVQELRRVEKENKTTILPTDKELDEILADSIQSQFNMSPEQFYQALAQQGIGRQTYREQVRAEFTWQQYMRGRYGSRMRVSQDQVKAVQQKMADAASKPQYQVSEIYIDANSVGGMQVAFNGAQSLIDQMQQGAPFPQVARQFSASATAASGGDAGWVSPGEMPPQVDAALEQLRPGQLSPPVATDDGVYILYLRDKRAGGAATLVTLKQAAIQVAAEADQPTLDAAAASLERVRALNPTCADLEAKAGQVPGVLAGDLGEAELSGLAPGFAEAAANTPEGQLSTPAIRTQGGMHLVMVCGKRSAAGEQLTAEQIERRLIGQQLVLVSKRVMRDLRAQATIETR
jgi:peptidyl-prolyl cis-trans isomerase SurA